MTDRAHRMLYREIPQTSPCKAGCGNCCGPVPWSDAEFDLVRAQVPISAEWIVLPNGTRALMDPTTGMCPFLAANGGCGVYDRRPFMCRIFAASAETVLTCPHGTAAKRPLSERRTCDLTEKYAALDRQRDIKTKRPPAG